MLVRGMEGHHDGWWWDVLAVWMEGLFSGGAIC